MSLCILYLDENNVYARQHALMTVGDGTKDGYLYHAFCVS